MTKSIKKILDSHNINGFHLPGGTDKANEHSYDRIYESMFTDISEKNITLLEIGIFHGGSILLWQDFFPKGRFCFIDIEDSIDKCIRNKIDNERSSIYIRDAYNEETIKTLEKNYPEGFDIIIDDGVHTADYNLIFIEKYFPLLNKGGVIVIEDIPNDRDAKRLHDVVTNKYKDNRFLIIDLRGEKNRSDDVIALLFK